MVLIALAALTATVVGVVSERRLPSSRRLAQRTLETMLYVLMPFVSYVSIAHLRLTVSGAAGLGLGWVVILTVGLLAVVVSRRLGLTDRQRGAVICATIIANTGYLGEPIISATLGARALRDGVAWDQLISGPALFVLGFGVGARFGDSGTLSPAARMRRVITRNPPLWGVIAGLLVPPRWAPAPLPAISRGVVDALLVLGFFAAGVYLSAERRDEGAPLLQRPDRPVLAILVLRLAVAPLLLVGLAAATVSVPGAYLIQAAMPSGLSSLVVGQVFGLDQRVIATAILWGSLIVASVGLVVTLL